MRTDGFFTMPIGGFFRANTQLSQMAIADESISSISPSNIQDLLASKSPQIKAISEVIENFRTAIIEKDKAKFVNLFYGPNISWIGVLGDSTYSVKKNKNADALKADGSNNFDYSKWMDGVIAASKLSFEEKFWNISIQTDGDIASVIRL